MGFSAVNTGFNNSFKSIFTLLWIVCRRFRAKQYISINCLTMMHNVRNLICKHDVKNKTTVWALYCNLIINMFWTWMRQVTWVHFTHMFTERTASLSWLVNVRKISFPSTALTDQLNTFHSIPSFTCYLSLSVSLSSPPPLFTLFTDKLQLRVHNPQVSVAQVTPVLYLYIQTWCIQTLNVKPKDTTQHAPGHVIDLC